MAARGTEGSGWLGALGVWWIQLWLRFFGRRVRKAEVPWLDGPVGDLANAGEAVYARVAELHGLDLVRHAPEQGAGLVPDWSVLDGAGFDAARAHPAVRDFYEHTSRYGMDVWSESVFPARIFLWMLVNTVSRHMNQLNFPVLGLDTSRGMSSEVIPLRERASGATVFTGWLRRLARSGRVVYTGFYTTEKPPGHAHRCVKVVFPLPRGNATVLLRPSLDEDGSLRLVSSGERFGDPGFYRLLELDSGHWSVLHLRSLREYFHVFVDDEGTLRTDHTVEFLGMTVLRLHYKLLPRA